ncbi:MAG TPA: prepilin-type N-terminal cleavage/methylation domain-containing protein [Phycisphaerae bacterium]|nr:prepilin-type N-terminal cleavage/methylation domain-containing protein [Phycisphaerae bacterium]HQL72029.1 prepilin-type N-terminal cleavage/methylation domain-containing protein [Phycisphaerae bacterium]
MIFSFGRGRSDQGRVGGQRTSRGFTLVELLVVISIIALLLSLLVPTLSRSRELTKQAACLSNLSQLNRAWMSYAIAYRGYVMRAFTGTGYWALSGNTRETITGGILYRFTNSVEVYRCPADTSDHYRTYSASDYIGGNNWVPAPWNYVSVLELGKIQYPHETMILLEENDPRGYNGGSWVVYPGGDNWIDFSVSWHLGGANFCFADGHVEHWEWQDPRTPKIDWFYQSTPGNPDLARIQQAYIPQYVKP